MSGKVNTDIPMVIKTAIHAPIYEEVRELKKTNTQKELAKTLNVNPSTVNNIVNGNIHSVSLNKLIGIADILGIEMSITTSQAGVDTTTKITK